MSYQSIGMNNTRMINKIELVLNWRDEKQRGLIKRVERPRVLQAQ